jgi:hypothetical protein
LLVEAADRLGFTDALSRPLAPMRERRGRHDPGRVVRDLAVMLADGGECLADLCGVRISSRCSGRSRGQGRHGASSACVSAVGGWVARDGGDCWHQTLWACRPAVVEG